MIHDPRDLRGFGGEPHAQFPRSLIWLAIGAEIALV